MHGAVWENPLAVAVAEFRETKRSFALPAVIAGREKSAYILSGITTKALNVILFSLPFLISPFRPRLRPM